MWVEGEGRDRTPYIFDRCLGGWCCHSYKWGNRFRSEKDEPIVGYIKSEGSVGHLAGAILKAG